MTWKWGLVQAIVIILILAGLLMLLLQSSFFWQLFYPLNYKEDIINAAVTYDLDPYLLAAVIYVESKYFPRARSEKGALGLMQIMPKTGIWIAEKLGINNYSEESLYNPEFNINFGSWYLSRLLQEFNGDLIMALAAYNAGSGNVRSWMEKVNFNSDIENYEFPFEETTSYVDKIRNTYKHYRILYSFERVEAEELRPKITFQDFTPETAGGKTILLAKLNLNHLLHIIKGK